jgi:hypothetical protein
MPFRKHIEDIHAFEPEAIAAMSRAFEEACTALQIFSDDANGRETIAIRIIDLARNGISDSRMLRDRVLLESRSVASAANVFRDMRNDSTARSLIPRHDTGILQS